MSVLRHMYYGAILNAETMVALISRFEPRKSQFQVKLGQLLSKFQIFLQIHAYFIQFCLRIPKMLFIFSYLN